MKHMSTVSAVFMLTFVVFGTPGYAEGFLSSFFEPGYVTAQKSSCESALKKELSYEAEGRYGLPRSGFLAPDVFQPTFVSSYEEDGKLNYRFNVRAEGVWHLAISEDPFSGGRYLKHQSIVDSYRVVDLGILSEDDAESTRFDFFDRRYIEFIGKANCSYFSEDSRTPTLLWVDAGSW